MGAGDLNGDGKADLLFKDGSGNYAAWLMNNAQVLGGGSFGTASTDWHLI